MVPPWGYHSFVALRTMERLWTAMTFMEMSSWNVDGMQWDGPCRHGNVVGLALGSHGDVYGMLWGAMVHSTAQCDMAPSMRLPWLHAATTGLA